MIDGTCIMTRKNNITTRLRALSVAATGQVCLCRFPQVHALLVDAAQTLGPVHSGVWRRRRNDRSNVEDWTCFVDPLCCARRPTCRQAVVADGDGGGSHGHAAGQTAQHGLDRVAFGLLAVDVDLLLQLHGLKLHETFWRRMRYTLRYVAN